MLKEVYTVYIYKKKKKIGLALTSPRLHRRGQAHLLKAHKETVSIGLGQTRNHLRGSSFRKAPDSASEHARCGSVLYCTEH